MTEDKTYNGWTNYETWCANLWLANDEGLYNLVRETAEDVWRRSFEDDNEDGATYELAEWLKDSLFEIGGDYGLIPPLEGFARDFMRSALDEINFQEVAQGWIHDAKEES